MEKLLLSLSLGIVLLSIIVSATADFKAIIPLRVTLFPNESKSFDVIVENTGNETLKNLSIENLPPDVKAKPNQTNLEPNRSFKFLIIVPKGLEPGRYQLDFKVATGKLSKQKSVNIIVQKLPPKPPVYNFTVQMQKKLQILQNESAELQLKVNNTGTGLLENISLIIENAPRPLEFSPLAIDLLKTGNSTNFSISIPSGIKPGEYEPKFNISSARCSKVIGLKIKVKKLPGALKKEARKKIQEANSAIKERENEGFNLTIAKQYLSKAQKQFNKGNWKKAKKSAEEAINAAKKAKKLREAKKPKPKPKKIPWIWIVLGAILIIILILAFLMLKA